MSDKIRPRMIYRAEVLRTAHLLSRPYLQSLRLPPFSLPHTLTLTQHSLTHTCTLTVIQFRFSCLHSATWASIPMSDKIRPRMSYRAEVLRTAHLLSRPYLQSLRLSPFSLPHTLTLTQHSLTHALSL